METVPLPLWRNECGRPIPTVAYSWRLLPNFSNTGRDTNEPDAIFTTASLDEPAIMDFDVTGEDTFELSATLVIPDNPDDPNEYIYIGEVGRFKIEREGYHELQWPGTNSMITSADVDYMLQLGGWFMDREGKPMLSVAD